MITDIRLQQFRSYHNASFEFSEGVNIIVGPNGSGKTNLLESVLVLSRGKSYRATDGELIKYNSKWARLEAHTEANTTRTIKLENNPKSHLITKTFEINGDTFHRLSFKNRIPIVLFEPNHLLLLTSSPESRRNFIDSMLEQTNPVFSALLQHYRRTLAQRNTLLKKGLNTAKPQLFAWDIRLSELGGQIVVLRLGLLERLNEQANSYYESMANTKAKVRLVYQTKAVLDNYETSMLHKLESNAELDCLRGFTSIGPHRDDIVIVLNDHNAQNTASRGENRTLLLALKMLEVQLLETTHGVRPLLLLDDVFSELDGRRRQALTAFLQPYQTFITTTDADLVVQHFTETTNVVLITH